MLLPLSMFLYARAQRAALMRAAQLMRAVCFMRQLLLPMLQRQALRCR